MNHSEWIRNEFRKMSEDLGFVFTPREEIENRLARVRASMRKKEIEALLVVQKMDYYYLSGTTQDALLFVPLEGLPLLLVRRELERAKVESPLDHVVAIRSMRDFPLLIKNHYGRLPGNLGLELDVLPVKDYFRYQELFPGTQIVDSSPIFRDVRKIKSPFEINLVRKAGDIAKKVYVDARSILKEGMTEIEFGSLLDAVAKRYGHEGLLRIRSPNYEAYSWFVVTGLTGGIVSQSDSPIGGLGLSPAFPVGASRKVIKAHEPIILDLGICYHGYQSDQTRMYSIGEMPRKFINAYTACKEIHDAVLDGVRPGADTEALFLKDSRPRGEVGVQGQLSWTARTSDPFHRSRNRFGIERTAVPCPGPILPFRGRNGVCCGTQNCVPRRRGCRTGKHPGCHSQRV